MFRLIGSREATLNPDERATEAICHRALTMYSGHSEDSESMCSSIKWWLLSNSSNRQWSVHPINQRGQDLGEYHNLFEELKRHPDRFHAYMRMPLDTFQYIYELVE
jgi:hypothetical protein